MHELALEQRRELGVRAPWHVGDVTWGLRQHEGREDEWKIRIWQDGGRTVAWSWLKGDRALLEFDVRRDRLDLLDEILADPDARTAVAFEDDDENRVGELEPVGVREEFRRRGLGAAVCTFALRRLHEEGGRQAIVYCVTDPACGLYESLGFRRHATLVGYSRSSRSSSSAESNADSS